MTPEKPSRRWFQFSLRTLFVVMTLAAVSMPAVVRALRRWEDERTIKELTKALEEAESRSIWVRGPATLNYS